MYNVYTSSVYGFSATYNIANNATQENRLSKKKKKPLLLNLCSGNRKVIYSHGLCVVFFLPLYVSMLVGACSKCWYNLYNVQYAEWVKYEQAWGEFKVKTRTCVYLNSIAWVCEMFVFFIFLKNYCRWMNAKIFWRLKLVLFYYVRFSKH